MNTQSSRGVGLHEYAQAHIRGLLRRRLNVGNSQSGCKLAPLLLGDSALVDKIDLVCDQENGEFQLVFHSQNLDAVSDGV